MPELFHRCCHCNSFYDAERAACQWCDYEAPLLDKSDKPIVYDRRAVREAKMAEYRKLPAEAFEDCMGPPTENPFIRCGCLHCGPEGHEFEAIEMRWIESEGMWACPCTTCGGRGFQFDIHPVEPGWQCAECKHWYTPEKFTSKYAKCPKCGSTHANGWFDDEDENGEPLGEDALDDEFDEDPEDDGETDGAPPDEKPWEGDVPPYDPARGEHDETRSYREKRPDDIDFPRHHDRTKKSKPGEGDDDDIPF
jgi:hypothetical protein